MAELLIRVKDKTNADDPDADRLCSKRGDVVVVCPDGHPWSEAERTAPYWRIVKLPGIDPADLDELIRPEIDDTPPEPGQPPMRLLRRRAAALDLDALPAAVRAWLDDDSPGRAQTRSLVRGRAAVLALIRRKAALVRTPR